MFQAPAQFDDKLLVAVARFAAQFMIYMADRKLSLYCAVLDESMQQMHKRCRVGPARYGSKNAASRIEELFGPDKIGNFVFKSIQHFIKKTGLLSDRTGPLSPRAVNSSIRKVLAFGVTWG